MTLAAAKRSGGCDGGCDAAEAPLDVDDETSCAAAAERGRKGDGCVCFKTLAAAGGVRAALRRLPADLSRGLASSRASAASDTRLRRGRSSACWPWLRSPDARSCSWAALRSVRSGCASWRAARGRARFGVKANASRRSSSRRRCLNSAARVEASASWIAIDGGAGSAAGKRASAGGASTGRARSGGEAARAAANFACAAARRAAASASSACISGVERDVTECRTISRCSAISASSRAYCASCTSSGAARHGRICWWLASAAAGGAARGGSDTAGGGAGAGEGVGARGFSCTTSGDFMPAFLARGGSAFTRGRLSASPWAGAAAGRARFKGTSAGFGTGVPDAGGGAATEGTPAAMAFRKSSADAAAVDSAALSRGTPCVVPATAGARTLKGSGFATGAATFLTFFGDGRTAATPFGSFLAGGAAPLPLPPLPFASRACSWRAMASRMRSISDSSLPGGSFTGGSSGCFAFGGGVASSSSNVIMNDPALLGGLGAAANDGLTAAVAAAADGGASVAAPARNCGRTASAAAPARCGSSRI